MKFKRQRSRQSLTLKDYGPKPLIINIDRATEQNQNFRTTLWTGNDMQLTLMSIPKNSDIGVEIHEDIDQFIKVESGRAIIMMGKTKNSLNESYELQEGFAVMIPSGTWHNISNTGNSPLKLYSLYAPAKHPLGTVHKTKEDAQKDEND